MAIKKVKGLESEYSIMPNKVVNDDLSWAALGMLTYLLSKPDDWDVMISQLINKTGNSAKHTKRDGVYSILKELIDLGYIQRTRTSGDGYSKTDYTVSSEKLKPLPDKPDQVQPDTDDPTLQSKDNKKEQKDDKPPVRKRTTKPDAFKQFFAQYPDHRKGGTDDCAWKKWKAMKLTESDAEKAFAWVMRANSKPGWSESRFVMGIVNFIGQRMWLTDVEKIANEISTATSAPSNQPAADIHAQRQARLDEWERQMLAGGDEQCQNALGENGGDLWEQVESGQRGDAADRPAITLDDRDWQTD